MAVAGSCITMVPGFACQSALDDGQLQSILADYALPPIGIYTVYPSRAHLSAKVRVFVDFLSDKFANTGDK
jgi:DNA-binding transcriptional LysR family regulator